MHLTCVLRRWIWSTTGITLIFLSEGLPCSRTSSISSPRGLSISTARVQRLGWGSMSKASRSSIQVARRCLVSLPLLLRWSWMAASMYLSSDWIEQGHPRARRHEVHRARLHGWLVCLLNSMGDLGQLHRSIMSDKERET